MNHTDSNSTTSPFTTVDTIAGAANCTTSPTETVDSPPLPTNLRFQRRTSERAFYETTYRDRESTATMDYPSGTSPWATSPDATRASFSSDAPGPDLPAPSLHGGSEIAANGPEQPRQEDGYRPGSWSPEQQHLWQQPSLAQQPQRNEAQRDSTDENRRPQSARHHGGAQQGRQHTPQYKLQAKVTGLERSGKKDPILRFDVYVSIHLRGSNMSTVGLTEV